jgi:hypothetical protein
VSELADPVKTVDRTGCSGECRRQIKYICFDFVVSIALKIDEIPQQATPK